MSVKRSRLWAELNGVKMLASWSAGMPLPWSVMVSWIGCCLSLGLVVWVSFIWLPGWLAWMAFLIGAVMRWVRACSSTATWVVDLRLLLVMVTFCLSARGWMFWVAVAMVWLRLVFQVRPGTFLLRLASFSSWLAIALRSLRPSVKPETLGYLAMSFLTPSRTRMSSLSLLEASAMKLAWRRLNSVSMSCCCLVSLVCSFLCW